MTEKVTKTTASKASYYYKLFRVKRMDGRVTTVSMDPILVTRACQVLGGLRAVGKLVREAAFIYEPEMYKNCSGYVAKCLREKISAAAAERAALRASQAA